MRSVILACLLVAACAAPPTIVYQRPGTDAAQVDRDERQCRYEAIRASVAITHPNVFTQAAERGAAEGNVFRACMAARDYERIVVPAI